MSQTQVVHMSQTQVVHMSQTQVVHMSQGVAVNNVTKCPVNEYNHFQEDFKFLRGNIILPSFYNSIILSNAVNLFSFIFTYCKI